MTAGRARQPARSRTTGPAATRGGRSAAPARKRAPAKTPAPATKRASATKRAPATKRASATKRTTAKKRTTARRREPGRLRRVLTGDRVYVFVFIGVVAALVAMAISPLQNFTAAADRVDGLTETRDVLREEVDRLEERRERLQDPEEVELMARAHLGLVKPGEVPFVVVTPESEREPVDLARPEGAEGDPEPDGAWYHRLGRWLSDLMP
ncbi:MAG: septum formation initiator family protein [Egibacteraceae bacterium]